MPQTEAQRKASERNLRKGNERAYTRKADPPPAGDQDPPEDKAPRTVRARAAPAKPAKKPRKAPPRDPAPREPSKPSGGGGFLGGLLDGIRGG
jgi:hypothetical protein